MPRKPVDLLRKAAEDDTIDAGIEHDHGNGDAHHSHRLGHLEHTHNDDGHAVFPPDANGIEHVDDGRPVRTDALAKTNGSDHPVDTTIASVVTGLAALAEQRHAAELLVKENDYVVGFAEVLVKATAQMADRRPVDEDILRDLKNRLDAWAIERGLYKPNGGGS